MSKAKPTSPGTRSAQDLVADLLEHWAKGQEPNTEAALRKHPELASDNEAVVDLAFGEFCLRLDRGEFVNPRAFAAHFPECRSTLIRIMNGHQLTVDNSGLLDSSTCKKWPEPGDTFVGFSIVRELGRGAFARVYLATEPDLGGRSVVLKVGMHGGGEAKILGRLRHDNVVPIYAMRHDLLSGMTVVCMPYLGATTLADVIEHAFARPGMPARASVILDAAKPSAEEEDALGPQKISPILRSGTYVEGVLDMGIQLAEALAFVHKRKIYHRDLKPTNVLVRPDGRPMLLDFNLSFDEQAAQQTLGGTLIYMAPEMLRVIAEKSTGSGILDARADLYSLGVILYEMLSGEHPFAEILWGKSAVENRQRLAELQKTGLRPLREVNPQVDKKVARVVDRCLAYEPSERFQTAAELARALRQCLSGPQRWRRRLARHPYAVIGAVLTAVVLAVVVAVFLALREPYPQREFKAGLHAFERGQYAEAIDHLSHSLAAEQSAAAYLARGRAYMKLNKDNIALDDLTLADKLEATGQTRAALGYCFYKLGRYPLAVGFHKSAIEKGFKTAVVLNNLGSSVLQIGEGYEAAAGYFKEAIEADPRLQIAYYNLASLFLDKAVKDPKRVSAEELKEGVAAMSKALDLGPATAPMHLDAARLYIVAEKIEPRWQELALHHLAAAIECGQPPSSLKNYADFVPLHGAQFDQLTKRPAVGSTPPETIRVLDPLEGS